MKVIYNDYKYKGNNIYYGIGIRVGFASKEYIVDDERYINNLGFSYLLKCYIDTSFDNMIAIEEPSFLFVFMNGRNDSYDENVSEFFNNIFNIDISENEFDTLKTLAKREYENRYKDESFRALYKAYEIIGLSKQYSELEYRHNLDDITYEQFVESYRRLINVNNAVMLVNGDISMRSEFREGVLDKYIEKGMHDSRIVYRLIDPYVISDAHVIMKGRNKLDLDILAFRFDGSTRIIDRMTYFFVELMKINSDAREVFFDEYDCGIVMRQPQINASKEFFRNITTKEEFDRSKELIKYKLINSQEEAPFEYMRIVVWLRLLDVTVEEIVDRLNNMDYSSYADIAKRIRPIIHEAQILMR